MTRGTDQRMEGPDVYTIGHSTRPIDDFLALLAGQAVATLVDIRTMPRSRRHPQFDGAQLAESLRAAAIAYVHEPRLGGLRRPRKDSVNLGWRNESFRGYADYMEGDEFKRGLEALLAIARTSRTAIMCAEAVPWRCHRSLVADALTAAHSRVFHIVGAGAPSLHRVTPFLAIEDGVLRYPPSAALPLESADERHDKEGH
jgi:uncharacterized protein (DUF488 family)